MKNKVSKIFAIVLSIMFVYVNTVYCQKDWQSLLIQKPLPKKAKLRTKKFSNCAITAYFLKKQLVEGQTMTFYNLTYQGVVTRDTILSGNYFIKDGIAYIKSRIKGENKFNTTKYSIQGIFKICNTADGSGFIINPDETTKLSIETADILLCDISSEYKNTYYYKVYPIILKKKIEDNFGVLKIEFDNKTLENIVSVVDLKKWLNFRYDYSNKWSSNFSLPENYLKLSSSSKLIFKNGDVFLGQIQINRDELVPKKGIYKFANGETVKSDYFRFDPYNGYEYVSEKTEGEWIFADGSTESGNWLKKYKVWDFPQDEAYWELARKEYPNLSSAKTITEKHNLAIQLHKESQQKFNELKQKKENTEKLKQKKKEQRPIYLTKKYGEKWANLILKEKPAIGMTKEMVNEIELDGLYGEGITIKMAINYVKKTTTSENSIIEIWRLSPLIENQWRQTVLLGISAYDLYAPYFPTLIFKNGILTDILE